MLIFSIIRSFGQIRNMDNFYVSFLQKSNQGNACLRRKKMRQSFFRQRLDNLLSWTFMPSIKHFMAIKFVTIQPHFFEWLTIEWAFAYRAMKTSMLVEKSSHVRWIYKEFLSYDKWILMNFLGKVITNQQYKCMIYSIQ